MKTKNRPSGLTYIKHKENPTSFKKNSIPWNKGTKGLCKPNKTSFKKGERPNYETEFKSGDNLNEKNYNWKGDDVGYWGVHTYVQRRLGQANHCEICHTTKSTLYVWHNKDGKYRRNLADWVSLCHKCHIRLHYKEIMKLRLNYKIS